MARRSYSLDAMRVICISSVFIAHINPYNSGLPEGQTLISGPILFAGGVAVHFFIMLSAFLAGMSYSKNISNGYAAYAKKRALRLLPLNMVLMPFYLIVLCGFGFISFSWGSTIAQFILSSFLMQELLKFSSMSLNSPAWTISTLFILYLLTPILIRPFQRIKNVWVLLLIIVALTLIDDEYRQWLMLQKPNNYWVSWSSPFNRLFTYLDGLALSCAAKLMVCPDCLRRHISAIEVIVLGALVYGFSLIGESVKILYYLTPILIVLCYLEEGFLTRGLAKTRIHKGAPYVYAFYMLHWLTVHLSIGICDKWLGIWGSMSKPALAAVVMLTLVGTCLLSVLLYRYVEKRQW